MSIRVADYVFNTRTTVVREHYETVGGKQTRAIRITGLLRGAADESALISALDGITLAVSEDAPVEVSLRHGRRMLARREAFAREVNGRTLTGQFVLDLRAETAWEESADVHTVEWNPPFSGPTIDVENDGNAPAAPLITLVADGVLVTPGVSDGTRALVYEGDVESGSTLIFDSQLGEVRLDGTVVTGYTSGAFPLLAPGMNTLTYTEGPGSSGAVAGTVSYRDRWW